MQPEWRQTVSDSARFSFSTCSCTHTHTHMSTYMQYKPRVPGTSNGTRPSSLLFLCQRYANFREMRRFLSRYGSGVDAGALMFGNGLDSSMLFSMAPSPLRPLPPSVPNAACGSSPTSPQTDLPLCHRSRKSTVTEYPEDPGW